MVTTGIEILEILIHFKVGLKSTEAAHSIQEMEGNETISNHTV